MRHSRTRLQLQLPKIAQRAPFSAGAWRMRPVVVPDLPKLHQWCACFSCVTCNPSTLNPKTLNPLLRAARSFGLEQQVAAGLPGTALPALTAACLHACKRACVRVWVGGRVGGLTTLVPLSRQDKPHRQEPRPCKSVLQCSATITAGSA